MLRTLLVFVLLAAAGFAEAPDFAETKKKAEADGGNAQFDLAYTEVLIKNTAKDDAEIVKRYRGLAAEGDASAQILLGQRYWNGEGVSKDYVEAAKWYRKAAEQGNALGQFHLGTMYDRGSGVPRNYAEAVRLYRLAAEQGIIPAQHNLGNLYTNGQGVPKDLVQAHVWYNIAGANGLEFSKTELEKIEHQMTAEQTAEAMKLAHELFAKLPKGTN